MKKMLFIYNPKSGKGHIRAHLADVVECFSTNGYDVTIYPTKYALDAYQMIQTRADDFDIIVCSGGDGTLDETVSGLMSAQKTIPIGYIPAGSTNDFGNSVGIPKQMVQAADAIVNGEVWACDLGKMNEDYFVYVAAFGMFTDVSYQTKQELKNLIGHAAYFLEGIKRLGSWKKYQMKIESDEMTVEGEFVLGMISNSNSIGGIKGLPGKDIELNDGLFEVTLIRNPQTIVAWQDIISALLTSQQNNNVIRFKTSHLYISSEEPVAWTRDGESGGVYTDVELTNIKEALQIITEKQNIN